MRFIIFDANVTMARRTNISPIWKTKGRTIHIQFIWKMLNILNNSKSVPINGQIKKLASSFLNI
jgi:hypothetical protein